MTDQIDITALEHYAFADLAAKGKGRVLKKQAARQAIIVIAADWLSLPRIFVRFAWAGKETTTDFRARILSTAEIYSPRRFGLESNGMQVLFGDLVRDKAKQDGILTRFVPIYQPTNVDKDYRIRTIIEPVINEGRLIIPASLLDLRTEIRGFPTAHRKDLIDALASAIALVPKRASAQDKNDEIEDLASYLRKMGKAPEVIEQRIKAAYAEANLRRVA